ncbi:MAG TPA: transglutaminase family protein [Polaromonas sp.]|uniref:transglutaminase-like domain-containing protein n=1 Tax=Polaromonas sp. TaxID=1869339 RepID=UPI002D237C53|nr:transglutaminase family protein [Polaromonas sp.]HYW55336.1 transglutaminase family protein [Polaromonas sp.]
MVRLKFSIELNYLVADAGCDFIFNIQAARTAQQRVVAETLGISQILQPESYTDAVTHTRFLMLKAAPGPLTVSYDATVDIEHHLSQPDQLMETGVLQLPGNVLPYLYPSRYCQSDRLHRLAVKEFGHMRQGYSRVQAIRDWVNQRVTFTSNSSTGNTTAIDTLIDEAGVCRDFAHLMIALCRAVNIPARFVSGIDYGADPALGPTDFHAYVEVYVGHRWYMFDPSGTAIPMGFVRLATGRDAADSAFATMFGGVSSSAPVIAIEALPDDNGNLVTPQHLAEALSSASA